MKYIFFLGTQQAMAGYIAVGSSHFRKLKGVQDRSEGIRNIEGLERCYFFPGIMMLNERRTPEKRIQFENFKKAIRNNTARGVILDSISNDWESFLTVNGSLLKISEGVIRRWDACNLREKEKWSYRDTHLLKEGNSKIKEGLDRYGRVLKEIFSQSNTSELMQLSVLERRYTRVGDSVMDLLFATLNSMLKQWCKSLILLNVRGKKLTVRFTSLSKPFHRALMEGDIYDIFQNSEVYKYRWGVVSQRGWGNYMVHRTWEGYREVFGIINEGLNNNNG